MRGVVRGSGEGERWEKGAHQYDLGAHGMTRVQIRFCWTQVTDNSAIFLT